MKRLNTITVAILLLGTIVGCQSIERQRLDAAVDNSKPLNTSRCTSIVKKVSDLYEKGVKERADWVKRHPDIAYQYGKCFSLYGENYLKTNSLVRAANPKIFETIDLQFKRLVEEKLTLQIQWKNLNEKLRGGTAFLDAPPEMVFP